MLIPVTAGHNQIELKFIPQGFYLAAIISGASILCGLILLIIIIIVKSQKTKRKALLLQTELATKSGSQIRPIAFEVSESLENKHHQYTESSKSDELFQFDEPINDQTDESSGSDNPLQPDVTAKTFEVKLPEIIELSQNSYSQEKQIFDMKKHEDRINERTVNADKVNSDMGNNEEIEVGDDKNVTESLNFKDNEDNIVTKDDETV